jgi:hypothetical protein
MFAQRFAVEAVGRLGLRCAAAEQMLIVWHRPKSGMHASPSKVSKYPPTQWIAWGGAGVMHWTRILGPSQVLDWRWMRGQRANREFGNFSMIRHSEAVRKSLAETGHSVFCAMNVNCELDAPQHRQLVASFHLSLFQLCGVFEPLHALSGKSGQFE